MHTLELGTIVPAICTSYLLESGHCYLNQCVPIKSNIQIIQTDTPFVILRKHPRFSISQKDDS